MTTTMYVNKQHKERTQVRRATLQHNARVDSSITDACPVLVLPVDGVLQHAAQPSDRGRGTMRRGERKCIPPRPRTVPKPASAVQGRKSHSNTRSSLVTPRTAVAPAGTAAPSAKRCFSPLTRMPWTRNTKHAPAVYPPAPPRRHTSSSSAGSSSTFAGT